MHIKRAGLWSVRTLLKKGKDHFGTFNAHFILAQFLIILHLSKKGRCRLLKQTDALKMYNIGEVRRLGMRERVKTRNDNGHRIWIFSQKLPFSVGKKCFKDKFRKYNTLYLYVI